MVAARARAAGRLPARRPDHRRAARLPARRRRAAAARRRWPIGLVHRAAAGAHGRGARATRCGCGPRAARALPKVAAGAGVALVLVVIGAGLADRRLARTTSVDAFTEAKAERQTDPARVCATNSGNRWVWWKEAVGATWDEPVFGYGAGSFPLVHLQYRNNAPRRAPAAQRAAGVPRRRRGWSAARSASAALALLAAAAVVAHHGARPGAERAYAGALLAALPGLGAAHVGRLGLGHPRRDGARAAVPRRAGRAAARHRAGRRRERRRGLARAARRAASLLALFAALGAAARARARGVQRRRWPRPPSGGPANLREADEKAATARRLDPFAIDPVFTSADLALRRGDVARAARLLADAVREPARQPAPVGAAGPLPGAVGRRPGRAALGPRRRSSSTRSRASSSTLGACHLRRLALGHAPPARRCPSGWRCPRAAGAVGAQLERASPDAAGHAASTGAAARRHRRRRQRGRASRRAAPRAALAQRVERALEPLGELDLRAPAQLAAARARRRARCAAPRPAARARCSAEKPSSLRPSSASTRSSTLTCLPRPMLNAPVTSDSAASRLAAHHVADVDVVAGLQAVAEHRRRSRPPAACRRRSRSRRPRRAGPGAGRRRCRSAATPWTGRAGGRTARSSPRRRTSTGRRAPRGRPGGPRARGGSGPRRRWRRRWRCSPPGGRRRARAAVEHVDRALHVDARVEGRIGGGLAHVDLGGEVEDHLGLDAGEQRRPPPRRRGCPSRPARRRSAARRRGSRGGRWRGRRPRSPRRRARAARRRGWSR